MKEEKQPLAMGFYKITYRIFIFSMTVAIKMG